MLSQAGPSSSGGSLVVKAEPYAADDVSRLRKPDEPRPQHVESQTLYKMYESAEDIDYLPEDALEEGLKMVKAIKSCVKKIDKSKLRREVWEREIER